MSNKPIKQINIVTETFKVVEEEVPFNIPTQPMYFFRTGIRQSVKVVPIWTEWKREREGKEEEIWKLKFVTVGQSMEAKIESFEVQLSQIGSIIKTNSTAAILLREMQDPQYPRSKEQFEKDFKECLKRIKS